MYFSFIFDEATARTQIGCRIKDIHSLPFNYLFFSLPQNIMERGVLIPLIYKTE